MRFFLFLIVAFLLFFQNVISQNVQFAREIIDTLTSEHFAGRGYVDNGTGKTADFIEKIFRSSELHRFGDSYRQDFTIATNTITKAFIHNKKLIPGDDFVVSVRTGTFKGKRKVKELDLSQKNGKIEYSDLQKYAGKFVLFPPSSLQDEELKSLVYAISYSDVLGAAGYIIGTNVQPIWDVQFPGDAPGKPVLTIRGDDVFFKKLRKLNIEIESTHYPEYQVSNLYGYFPGTLHPDSLIIFCAHYDHLGKMGNLLYPGANDNASGVAMMLDLMNYFSDEANRLPFSVVFIAFAAEEAGLKGAKYFTNNAPFLLENISFLINLDLVGTGREGIQVVNGSIFQEHFDLLLKLNEKNNHLPDIRPRGEACNSDHCPFFRKGVRSFYIYTLDQEYKWYHVPQDDASRLPLTGYEGLFRLIVGFSRSISDKN